jgi:hypothetical protein
MKKNIILKKIKFLKKFQYLEMFRLVGRIGYSDLRLTILTRYFFYFYFLLKDFYMTKKNLFCFFSYKNMGIIKPFKMYRMVFRQ